MTEPVLEVSGLQTHFFTRAGVAKAVDNVNERIAPAVEGFETFDDLVARGVLVRSGGPTEPPEEPATTREPAADPGASLIDLL